MQRLQCEEERQRLRLRQLLGKPDIVILDE
jgi:hypothetical protein